MQLNLQGKSVVITGGATGIGKAIALEFLREGAKVAICGRTKSKLEHVQAEFAQYGFALMTRVADVTNYDELSSFADAVKSENGEIDIWINNAGSNQLKGLMDYSVDEFEHMVNTLLISVFSGSKIAALHMRSQKKGVIINASSFTALIPSAGSAPYSACKAAVSSLTRTFAAELAADNIRVLAFVPGMIATDISQKNIELNRQQLLSCIPMQRFGTPEDCAKMVVFLASDCASYVNGTQVEISGGKFCVQNPLYAYETKM